MTNAERIRSMTDDELFRFIDSVLLGDLDYGCTFCDLCESYRIEEEAEYGNELNLDCDGCLKRWLTLDSKEHPKGIDFGGN